MDYVEGIPWNCNPKDMIRFKHLTNGVDMFIPFLGPTCHFCKSKIQAPYKFSKEQVVHNAHFKVCYGLRMGEGTLRN